MVNERDERADAKERAALDGLLVLALVLVAVVTALERLVH